MFCSIHSLSNITGLRSDLPVLIFNQNKNSGPSEESLPLAAGTHSQSTLWTRHVWLWYSPVYDTEKYDICNYSLLFSEFGHLCLQCFVMVWTCIPRRVRKIPPRSWKPLRGVNGKRQHWVNRSALDMLMNENPWVRWSEALRCYPCRIPWRIKKVPSRLWSLCSWSFRNHRRQFGAGPIPSPSAPAGRGGRVTLMGIRGF